MSEPKPTMDSFAAVEALYKSHRYQEAFELSRSYWNASTDVDRLSLQELVLGCRLAARLGGGRVARWLMRKALARDPSNPAVRYYSQSVPQRGQNLFDTLRADMELGELRSGDPELDSGWLAYQGLRWATLRDFEQAGRCIAKAHAIRQGDAWVLSCESSVLGLQDRWLDALTVADAAWEADPSFYTAGPLGNSLLALGRIEEAAARLNAASNGSQSYELVLQASSYQCALAETLDQSGRKEPLERARHLVDRLPALVRLSDRDTRAAIARAHLEIATLVNDHQEIERWANEARAPFYRRVLENLRKNPQGPYTILPFRRSKQKYQTCLPSSLTSALAAMGCALDAELMAAETTHGGTRYWAAADWLQQREFVVRFFPVTADVAVQLIRNGIAFVLGFESEDAAHAVAAVGVDEAAGTLLIYDPSGFRTRQYLLEALGKDETPLGPKGMVVVPTDRADLVDRILPPVDSEVMMAHTGYEKTMSRSGLTAAQVVLEGLATKHPDHPGTRYLQAMHHYQAGRGSQALSLLQDLAASYPNSGSLRANLVAACTSLGNSALLKKAMADVVESRILPGVESQQAWRYAPAAYVCNYADLLRRSASSRREARGLLNSVLNRQSGYSDAWRVLGDWLWHEGDQEGRTLALRIASCLSGSNEYYARAYCDALCSAHRESEGLSWLEARTVRFRDSPGAAAAWITFIGALEHWGRPEEALSAATTALDQCSDSDTLLAFFAAFFARMGHWDRAEGALKKLQSLGNTALFHNAATEFYDMRGDSAAALKHVEQWVQESPRWMTARQRWLELINKREGGRAAAKLAAQWMAEHPGHDEFERLYCNQPETSGNPRWKKDLLLRRRVKRNSEDGWAWREMLFRRLSDYAAANVEKREKLRPQIIELLRQCDRTAPEDAATLRAHAQWSEVQGNWFDAVSGWLKAIDADPRTFYSYRRLWECCASYDAAEQQRLLGQIEPRLLHLPGHLSIARDLAFLLAFRFGASFAEESVMRWKAHRQEDPDVVQAAAELLLQYGLGLTDATRAAAMLEIGVAQFPHALGLRFALANAQGRTGKHDDAVRTLVEITRRHPGNTTAFIQLARALEQSGKSEEARQLMLTAAERNPLSPEIWDLHVQVLARARRFPEARAVIAKGLEKLTDGVWWREKAVRLLLECGDAEGAVTVARDGVRLYPRGAYLWNLLASTLKSVPNSAKPGEMEACLRRSLELNSGYFDPADHLALLLVEQSRFDEAEHVMLSILPSLADPSTAKGRLAWIYRKRGRRQEAVDEIASVLHTVPWFRWGWAVLMEWLEEDKSWKRAKSLLSTSPDALRNDMHYRRRRLALLEKAGASATDTDREWNSLLQDFPRDLALHLQRYDSLRAQKRIQESAGMLHRAFPLDPKNPNLQARLVEMHADENQKAEASDLLLAIWFAEVERSGWPAHYAWLAMQRAGLADEVYRRARALLEKGSRPTPQALALMARHAMKEQLSNSNPKPIWSEWFPSRSVRELLELLQCMDKIAGAGGSHRGELLGHLMRTKHYRTVIRYWKRNRDLANADVNLWANAGCALVSTGHKRGANKLLSGWRTRQGVRMWMVCNYVLSRPQSSRAQKRHVLTTCQDVLSSLPHDHSAKFLAHVLAEMQVLLDDREGFCRTLAMYQPLLSGVLREQEYFSAKKKYLLASIPEMGRTLEQGQTGKFARSRLKLRLKHSLLTNIGRD